MKDDTISRAVAIKSIQECADVAHDNYDWDTEEGYLKAIECIEELPPAQPTDRNGQERTGTDLISRQAAIKTLMAAKTVDPSIVGCASNAGVDWCIDAIKALPSAQPEIMRCKDCRYNNDCEIQYSAQSGDEFFCGCAEGKDNG